MSKTKLPRKVKERFDELKEAQQELDYFLERMKTNCSLTPLQIIRMLLNSMLKFHKAEVKRQFYKQMYKEMYRERVDS